MLTSVKYWLWLTCRLDPRAAWAVFCHFGNPERAYFSDPEEYAQIQGLTPGQCDLLKDKSVTAAEEILSRCDNHGIRILTFSDTDFPERLRNIEIPPLVLYLRGRMLRFDDRAVIAMAGTRHASLYGMHHAYRLAQELTQGGALVATGVVVGCDAHAAKGALAANGPLVCVVAGGVDVPYYHTAESQTLLQQVAAHGAVLSEAPPGTPHKGALFARRNAILTGLSVGLLCIEAGSRSGTLAVAALANEQGKDVFAIPANLGAKCSLGTNDLLRQGLAYPVLSGADILSHYTYLLPGSKPPEANLTRWQVFQPSVGPEAGAPVPAPTPSAGHSPLDPPAVSPTGSGLQDPPCEKKVDTASDTSYIELLDASGPWSEEERTLLTALVPGPATVESLIAHTGLPAGLVSATLTMLAVAGAVQPLPGGSFRLALNPS